MLVQEVADGETFAESLTAKLCRTHIQAILDAPPSKIDSMYAVRLRIDLQREYIRPGLYVRCDGALVYIFGPTRQQPDPRQRVQANNAYKATLRVVRGDDADSIDQVLLFGPNGFFDAYRRIS